MALDVQGSPVEGMPILNRDKVKNAGFTRLPNRLFHIDHSTMVYGDDGKPLIKIITGFNQGI
jgi:NAD/NADP transhydrogenase beta subunit